MKEVSEYMQQDVSNFKAYRDQKQTEADQALHELYESYFSWLEKNTNLREKVRAKHIFKEKTDMHPDKLNETSWLLQFEHWFAFDYVTVIGSKMFDLYVRKNQGYMTKKMLELSGLIMTSAIQPFQTTVNERERGFVKGVDPVTGIKLTVYSLDWLPLGDLKEGDYSLLRYIRCGFRDTLIAPPAPIKNAKQAFVIQQMKEQHGLHENLQWLRFLKEGGVSYLAYMKE
ncbi:hypothetical protein [Bacillus sp. FJAT-44742]|uniref:hypothetical protein n=1 Tax=Bacillus sp. FJAT-44742 TaxID=2014005 RepID=UPI0018E2427E|nr:hypothetical protein [Bacillus sp. FJAT-44742]